MQLPRGTFREIKKGTTIEDILAELERSKFSGVCSISSSAGTGTLVYKAGKSILVKFLGKSGDPAWDELQSHRSTEVDAALSTLDDAQIQLSLEFNKACRLVKAGSPAGEARRPAPPAAEPVRKPAPPAHTAAPAPAPAARPLQKPAPASTLFHRPAPPVQPVAPVQPSAPPEPKPQRAPAAAPARPAMPAPPAMPRPAPKSETPVAEEGPSSSFEKDIDTFDTMDLDNVTDKIRNDCKTMIKQLHLEHLMER